LKCSSGVHAWFPAACGRRARVLVFMLVFLLQGAGLCPAATNSVCRRIVSLAPNLTELVFSLGLGDRLVGRSSACDFPPDAKPVPVVGDFGRPNWEALQARNPDLVIATDVEKPGLLRQLDEIGIHHLLLPCESWKQLLDAGRAISAAAGEPAMGENWVRAMTAQRDALQRRTREWLGGREPVRVYVEIWGDPVTTVGRGCFLNDVVDMAGGTNIASSFKQSYVHVSGEWVIGEEPAAILRAYMLPQASSLSEIGERPGWGAIPAVQTGAICTTIPPDWLLRPGPRLLDGAEAFADWLKARFGQAGE
jgi:iron complex transport system substrate-binding protein